MNKETIEIPLVKATYEELQEVICELQVERIVKNKEIERLNNDFKILKELQMKTNEENNRLNNIIDELEKYFEEEQIRLARETSNIYEDSLGKTRLVNDDIFNEITRIKDKLKVLKEGK